MLVFSAYLHLQNVCLASRMINYIMRSLMFNLFKSHACICLEHINMPILQENVSKATSANKEYYLGLLPV